MLLVYCSEIFYFTTLITHKTIRDKTGLKEKLNDSREAMQEKKRAKISKSREKEEQQIGERTKD